MSFNLLRSAWLPLRRRSGRVEWATPEGVAHELNSDPVVGFAWGRADFDAAAHEFMIGLLSSAFAPTDDAAWRDFWRNPPSPQVLADRWQSVVSCFDLDGPGPRFLQDQDELEGAEEKDIAALLIDAPGDKTIRDNTDHFVKRDRVAVLNRAAATMTLFTLQAYAPSGGVGHRTSLRGGGPLTTLVEDAEKQTLWHRLWLAVEDRRSIESRNAASQLPQDARHVFPWMAPTRTSDSKTQGQATTPADVHALQVYWGMPRRIRLLFEPAAGRTCTLTGQADDIVVRAFRTRNYGTNYTDGFRHPLSPHYRSKDDGPWLAVHGQRGGIGYRHWLGLLVASTDNKLEPASVVTAALRRRSGAGESRLMAHGYDMDNMKPRGFVSGVMPAVGLSDPERAELVRSLAEALILATDQAVRLMLGTIKAALFDGRAEARGDLSFYGERLWRESEAEFYATLRRVNGLDPKTPQVDLPLRRQWRLILQKAALGLFDEVSGADDLDVVDMARVASARRNLLSGLFGYGNGGRALFKALDLPLPKVPPKRRKGEERAGREVPT